MAAASATIYQCHRCHAAFATKQALGGHLATPTCVPINMITRPVYEESERFITDEESDFDAEFCVTSPGCDDSASVGSTDKHLALEFYQLIQRPCLYDAEHLVQRWTEQSRCASWASNPRDTYKMHQVCICVSYMCLIYVSHMCVSYMCLIYVSHICVPYMCPIYVSHICVSYMCLIYVHH